MTDWDALRRSGWRLYDFEPGARTDLPTIDMVGLAIEALQNGACRECTEFLTGLSADDVAAIEVAVRGEGAGYDVDGGIYMHPHHLEHLLQRRLADPNGEA